MKAQVLSIFPLDIFTLIPRMYLQIQGTRLEVLEIQWE